VAASIFPLYDIARRVAGPQASVALVLPAGQMDHTFEPRPQDLVRLARVELAFGVGLGLDPWLRRIVDAATDGRARVEEIGLVLDPRPLPDHVLALVGEPSSGPGDDAGPRDARAALVPSRPARGAPGGPLDPHVHLDPVRMARAVTLIGEALAARDPAGTVGYRARAIEVRRQIEALDAELRARSRAWTRRTIVTFHGSFFYFAEAYGLTVAAVVEPLPGREPNARYVASVVEAIRKSGAAAIFTEPQLDPAPARLIASETGLPLFELDPVGGGPGALSYEALLRKNMAVLDEALR
jgi:zinc transport system substrate-binding protein/manganese/iron transport system substrate-binding protein